jgi:hypothetical protein
MGRTAFGDNDRNRRLRHESKIGDPEPDDAQGTWPREQLEAMDRRFVERVERAFENGSERRQPNANSLGGQIPAGFLKICAIFQRDSLRRHF